VIAVVALFVFSLLHIAPGDPAAVIAGDEATPEDVARIREPWPRSGATPDGATAHDRAIRVPRGPHIAAVMFSKYPANKPPNERDVPKSCVGSSGSKRAERQARPRATDFFRSLITIDICRLRGALRLQDCVQARKLVRERPNDLRDPSWIVGHS
jgi:hypothetical protein